MTTRLIIIFVLLSIKGICQQGLSYPYYLTAQNDRFFLKSIPHGSQMYSVSGRTDIFVSSDSSLVYSIPRYFDPNGIVLSDDGNSILYVRYSIYNYDHFDEEVVLYYQDGKLQRTYKVDQLIQKNLDDYQYQLFYNEWQWAERVDQEWVLPDSIAPYKQKLLEWPLFTNGSAAYMATKDSELLQFDLDSGKLISRQNIETSSSVVANHYYTPKLKKPEFETPGVFHIPNLASGKKYQEAFEEEFDYKHDGVTRNNKFKYYNLDLTCLIDHEGKCVAAEADFEDSTLNARIEAFFQNQAFDQDAVPEITERWYFSHSASFRKSDSTVAVNERIEERKQERLREIWRIKQDTLDGIYIPKDLQDCFRELDKMLTENNREEFKTSYPISYHMGLGRNLRNRWGLWTSSRLREYFLDLGVTHPDDMSGIILTSYNAYLNGREIDLEKQLSKYRLIPRPKLKLPKDYK
jgi:hypothetical protein